MISILIPTKEEPYVGKLVSEIERCLKTRHEIIIIDKSKNHPKIKNARIIIQKSVGLGNAVLEGLRHARGNLIVTMDGDGSHRAGDITRLVRESDKSDIVIGSRFVRGGVSLDRSHRKLVSFVFRKFASLVLGLKVEDSMSGFSCIRRNVYRRIKLNPMGYKINMEIMFKCRKNYKISEVPITFLSRKSGKSKAGSFAGVMEAIRILRYVIELRFGLR